MENEIKTAMAVFTTAMQKYIDQRLDEKIAELEAATKRLTVSPKVGVQTLARITGVKVATLHKKKNKGEIMFIIEHGQIIFDLNKLVDNLHLCNFKNEDEVRKRIYKYLNK